MKLVRFDENLANLNKYFHNSKSMFSNPSIPYVLGIGDISKLSQVYRGSTIAVEILDVNKLVFSVCFGDFLVQEVPIKSAGNTIKSQLKFTKSRSNCLQENFRN